MRPIAEYVPMNRERFERGIVSIGEPAVFRGQSPIRRRVYTSIITSSATTATRSSTYPTTRVEFSASGRRN